MTRYVELGKPIRLAGVTIRNRTLMAAMSSGLASAEGDVTDDLIAYYRARAEGGTGMVVVEFSGVDRTMGRAEATQLMLDRDAAIPGHARLAQSIRETGATAGIQLHLPGQFAHPGSVEGLPFAPSEEVSRRDPTRKLTRPMTEADIQRAITAFASAARRAVDAGYEAIELHGAHGYLLMAFLSPLSNRRDDGWGGDAERRLAFPTAVVAAIRAAIGPDVPIIYRLSSDEFRQGGLTLEDTCAISPALVAAGANAIDVSSGTIAGTLDRTVDPMSAPQAWRADHAARIKQAVLVPVFSVGPFREPALAEAALAEGQVDMVALGRPLLADAGWVGKTLAGAEATIRPCTNCNWCFHRVLNHQPVACAENPQTGAERKARPALVVPGARAVVVGAGPGGMAAALDLTEAGFATTLYERSDRLGGGLIASAAPPLKDKLDWYLDHLIARITDSGVDVQLGTAADLATLIKAAPHGVVLATGAAARAPGFELGPDADPVDAYGLLYGDVALPAAGAAPDLVYGGGETGCELAEYLAARGREVLLVTRSEARKLSRDAEPMYRKQLLERLAQNPAVTILDLTHLQRFASGEVTLERDGQAQTRAVANVFVAQGREPGSDLEAALADVGIPTRVIGDAAMIGRIGDAVHAARAAVDDLTGRLAADARAAN